MTTTQVLVLAAGHVEFQTKDGDYPLSLMEIDGVPVIERIVTSASRLSGAQFTFGIRDEDARRYHLDRVVELLAPGCKVVQVPQSTRGSACTALLAASGMPDDDELLIVSANELVDIELPELLTEFRQRKLDGGVITFHSVHPRYSYVRLNAAGLVSEASHQLPISKNATAGTFWFARVGDFVGAAKNMIRKDAHVGGSYYVAKAYNELILRQGCIGVHRLENKCYHPLKSERQAAQFEQHAEVAA